MTHSDDEGLVLPPKLAPVQVVIVPIPKPRAEINEVAERIMKELKALGISVQFDDDDKKRPGFKFAEHEMRGIPVRLGLGMRDIENGVIEVARRDTREKTSVPQEGVAQYVKQLLDDIQSNLFQRALKYREDHTHTADSMEEMSEILEADGGFVYAHWDGTSETELAIKDQTKATIRCIPNDAEAEEGKCILTGKPSRMRVPFAKAY